MSNPTPDDDGRDEGIFFEDPVEYVDPFDPDKAPPLRRGPVYHEGAFDRQRAHAAETLARLGDDGLRTDLRPYFVSLREAVRPEEASRAVIEARASDARHRADLLAGRSPRGAPGPQGGTPTPLLLRGLLDPAPVELPRVVLPGGPGSLPGRARGDFVAPRRQAREQIGVSQQLAARTLTGFFAAFEGLDPDALGADERRVLGDLRDALRAVRSLGGFERLDAPIDFEALAASPDENARKAAVAAMAALSRACKYPKLIRAAAATGSLVQVAADTLESSELQTSFIKAARSKIAVLTFKTTMMARLQAAVDRRIQPRLDISRYVAAVGFNRALSPNNMLGASLSSDIDFKLVIDDVALGRELTARALRLSPDPPDNNAVLDDIQGLSVETLKGVKEEIFEGSYDLTLEVEAFTVKRLSQIERDAERNETERNFLCTVFENNSLMSGSEDVRERFLTAIREGVMRAAAQSPDEPGLPLRNYNQYLGESDKGSILAIQHLPAIEGVVRDLVGRAGQLRDLAVAALREVTGEAEPNVESLRDAHRMLDVLNGKGDAAASFVRALLDAHAFSGALQNAPPMFEPRVVPNDPAEAEKAAKDRFKLLVKNLKAFTEGGRHAFIGSANATAEDWVFSNKYGGARLNDFFDATLRDRYIHRRGVLPADLLDDMPADPYDPAGVAELGSRYDHAQRVAHAINRFAVQLQDRIYELHGLGELAMSHGDLDELYARVTAEEFAGMLDDPTIRANLDSTLTHMVSELGRLGEVARDGDVDEVRAFRGEIERHVRELRSLQREIAQVGSAPGRDDEAALARIRQRLQDLKRDDAADRPNLRDLDFGAQLVTFLGAGEPDGDDPRALREVRDAARRAADALAMEPGRLKDADLAKLLGSEDPEKRKAGLDLVAAMSRAAGDRAVVAHVISQAGQGADEQRDFATAVRATAARAMLESEIKARMRSAAAGILPPGTIDSCFTALSFSRLLGETPTFGSQPESDVDCSIVLDDVTLRRKLREQRALALGLEDWGSVPPGDVEQSVTELKKRMQTELEATQRSLTRDFGFTAGTQGFGVRDLSDIFQKAVTSEREKDFLASVYESHTAVGGSEEVRAKFADVIKLCVIGTPVGRAATERGVVDREHTLENRAAGTDYVTRIFNRYLGDSESGSLRSLQKLGQIDTAIAKFAELVATNDDEALQKAVRKHLEAEIARAKAEGHPDPVAYALGDPTNLARFLGDPTMSSPRAQALLRVALGSAEVGLFPGKPPLERMRLLLQNRAALTRGGSSELAGAGRLRDPRRWVFAGELGAPRLHDFFAATSRDRFTANMGVLIGDDMPSPLQHPAHVGAELGARYDDAKAVADAMNGFHRVLEERVAAIGGGQPLRLTPADLDAIMKSPDGRAAFLEGLDGLVAKLKTFRQTGATPSTERFRIAVRTQAAALERNRPTDDGDAMAQGGHLFTALTVLAGNVVDVLDPSRPPSAPPPSPMQRSREKLGVNVDSEHRRHKALGHRLFNEISQVVTKTAAVLKPRDPPRRPNAPAPPPNPAMQAHPGVGDGTTRRKTSVSHRDAAGDGLKGRRRKSTRK